MRCAGASGARLRAGTGSWRAERSSGNENAFSLPVHLDDRKCPGARIRDRAFHARAGVRQDRRRAEGQRRRGEGGEPQARVKKPSRHDAGKLGASVYEQIKADIFEFRLLPGARFSENEVAARMRVARTPVREALFRLEREGYVQVHAKSGWSVRTLDFDALDHLYDLRLVLESAAVQRLCAGDPKLALAGLERIWLVAPRSRLADGARVARLDEEFHA